MRTLYFAYGSNLNKAQMRLRCPDARPYARARLHDWSLEFRGVLTIVPKAGAVVEGALWLTTPRDEAALDRYEGFPRLYDKREVWVEVVDAPVPQQARAYVYVMNGGAPHAPSRRYLEICLEGARDWGIPETALLEPAIRSVAAAWAALRRC